MDANYSKPWSLIIVHACVCETGGGGGGGREKVCVLLTTELR